MLKQKDNSENYLGSAVFIVLFFVFICAFAGNVDSHAGKDSRYKSVSEQHAHVIALNDSQQVSWQKSVICLREKADFRLISVCHKIVNDNKSIHTRLLSLQKTEFLAKPVLQQRLSYWYHSSDTSDLPDLS